MQIRYILEETGQAAELVAAHRARERKARAEQRNRERIERNREEFVSVQAQLEAIRLRQQQVG